MGDGWDLPLNLTGEVVCRWMHFEKQQQQTWIHCLESECSFQEQSVKKIKKCYFFTLHEIAQEGNG